jgi:parvulin-like peptidyl-prolyl isomerase
LFNSGRKPAKSAIAGLFFIGSLICLFTGCSRAPTVNLEPPYVPPDKTVVTLNGEPVSLEEFDNEFLLMQIHYSAVSEGDMRHIKRRLFEQVINRRLLLQEARRVGLKMTQAEAVETVKNALQDTPEDFWIILKRRGVGQESWKRKILQEKLVSKLVDQEVNSKVRILPEEVEEYYWSHLSEYWRPAAVHDRHLVVKRKTDLLRALDSLKKGEDFAKVAATFSQGPEKAQGGDGGFMNKDRLDPHYIQALSALKPGEISKPLEDNFGYHLFQLIEWRPRQMRSFQDVKDQIRDTLLKEEQDLRFDQWMADLKKKSMIKVNQEMAPLVGVNLEGLSEE